MSDMQTDGPPGKSGRHLPAVVQVVGILAVLIVGVVVIRQLSSLAGRMDEQEKRLARMEGAATGGDTPPATVEMSFSDDWIGLGRSDAAVTVVEFTDYECPFCRQFHQDEYAKILSAYVDSGKVRWVSRDLPLRIHPYAAKAAEAVHCARESAKYWEFRDALLSTDMPLSADLMRQTARNLSLDADGLMGCVNSGKYSARVANDIADARVLQIDGTPAFVIAKSSRDILTGTLIVGSAPISVFRAAIDSILGL